MGINLDSSFNDAVYSEICLFCRHFIDINARSCAAFDVIPMPIWNGTNDHTKPFPGDNGIQFEPVAEDDTDASINRNQGR